MKPAPLRMLSACTSDTSTAATRALPASPAGAACSTRAATARANTLVALLLLAPLLLPPPLDPSPDPRRATSASRSSDTHRSSTAARSSRREAARFMDRTPARPLPLSAPSPRSARAACADSTALAAACVPGDTAADTRAKSGRRSISATAVMPLAANARRGSSSTSSENTSSSSSAVNT